MDLSGISNFGWIVIGIVVILIILIIIKYTPKGKRVKTPFFEMNDENETPNDIVNRNIKIQESTIFGNVGDNTYYNVAPQISPLQRNVYELCVKVLLFAKAHNNMVSSKDLGNLCGENADIIYQMIHDENVFHSIAGQRHVGIGKMKKDDIDRLITKYRIELSKS